MHVLYLARKFGRINVLNRRYLNKSYNDPNELLFDYGDSAHDAQADKRKRWPKNSEGDDKHIHSFSLLTNCYMIITYRLTED